MSLAQFLPTQSKTVKAIYTHYKKVGDAEPPRDYLGASIIGHPCERYLWYCFRQCCKPNFDGRMYRLFETGDLEEARFVENLRAIGCKVHDTDENGEQFEVSAFGGHFLGHMDSAILGIPEAPKTWHVGEFKTHNAKSFAKLKKEGVQKSKPQHYAQVMVYMHLTGMKRALYLARNKDTDELYSERIRYDKAESKALMERAHRIITTSNPPDRIANRADYYQCSWCDAKAICWSDPDKPVLFVPSLSCRQCCHATPCLDRSNGQWLCEKHKRSLGISKACEDHLVLPGLLAFTEPTDYRECDGKQYTEFANADGKVWRHGNAHGCFSSKELCELPASVLVNDTVQGIKDLFDAKAIGCVWDILERYPEEDSRIIWKGLVDELETAWRDHYEEEVSDLNPVMRCNMPEYSAVEMSDNRVAIVWKDSSTAEIREGIT